MSRVETISPPRKMTVEEYLEFERNSDAKHDYVDGQVIDVRAMAGTTAEHASIQLNWLVALANRLQGKPCRPFGSDLKVRAVQRTRYRYPDLSVVCHPIEYDPRESTHLTLVNPKLIVEILSDSTEIQDRGDKFKEYLQIDSFREYVLTSQRLPIVETFFKRDDGQWLFNFSRGLDAAVKLQSLGIEVPLREIFAGVEFSPEALADDAT